MHKSRFRLGLRPRSRWGVDSAPDLPAVLGGLLLRGGTGREGEGKGEGKGGEEKREREREGRERGGKGEGKGLQPLPIWNPGYATVIQTDSQKVP